MDEYSFAPSHDDPGLVETIAAISTPPGRGGIGIVRLSGPEAASIAAQLLRLRGPLVAGKPRLADVIDPEAQDGAERIDEALVTFFAAPHSYTTEDLVEIAAHGSPVVLDLLLRRAIGLGARLAHPGEFTQRAFLAGRLDLTQAEAVRDLIDAQTLAQARQAASQLGGALSRRVQPVKGKLLELIALLEAGIDFAEDDLSVAGDEEILGRIEGIEEPLRALEGTFARGRVLHDGLTLAIVGRPNAGKSSLFNALVERDRAIVTPIPGTTRDTVSERIALEGIPLELVDTAGLRDAPEDSSHPAIDDVERLGIARSREALADAAIVLVVVDSSLPVHAEDERLIEALAGRPVLVAANKCDLPAARDGLLAQGVDAIATSAVTGQGIDALRQRIVGLATGGAAAEPGMLTSLRHHQAVTTALDGLVAGRAAVLESIPHEMVLLDLYRSLWALDALTGQTTADDVLNLIFATFCIGK